MTEISVQTVDVDMPVERSARRVDLFSLSQVPAGFDWPLGDIKFLPERPGDLTAFVNESLNPDSGFILFWDFALGHPDAGLIEFLIGEPVDIWHAGLSLGMKGLPKIIDHLSPTWMLNRDADAAIESTSWRISLRACLVRTLVIQDLEFIRAQFRSLEGASLEWGYRCLTRGAIVRHSPLLVSLPCHTAPFQLPFEDEARFAWLHFGKKWTTWALVRSVLTGRAQAGRAFRAWRKVTGEARERLPVPFQSPTPYLSGAAPSDTQKAAVSVIIPTLDRYPYLQTLLQQMRSQTIPPLEIIVIDQTELDARPPEFYTEFNDLPLRILYLHRAGQCSSRNSGLASAKGEYILFLDDDDEVPSHLIEAHLENLNRHAADVSSGVADVPEEGDLPMNFTFRRVSDVFPTNNSMVRRGALQRSGLFDLAYDHGARADGDLGMRLHLSGARMTLEPSIRVLHHHAPRGGLRAHKARVITYASSRKSLTQRNLPSVTELYLGYRYFSPAQVREAQWMRILGTFSLHEGSVLRHALKALISAIFLPGTLRTLRQRERKALEMLKRFPQIPGLD